MNSQCHMLALPVVGSSSPPWRWDIKWGHQNLGPLTATSLCVCEWRRSPLKANHFGHVEVCNFYYVVWSYCRLPYLECLQERSAGGQVRFGDSFILQEALCIFKIWVLWYNLILYLIFTKLALSLLFSINDCAFRGELILFKTRFCILQFDCEYGILKHFCSLIVQLKTLKNKY